jgi:hypothetical protein
MLRTVAVLVVGVVGAVGALRAGAAVPAAAPARPHPVTASVEAQKLFDEGLARAFASSHGDAERWFREAARADSKCAMAWWGIALVLGQGLDRRDGDEKAAVAALGKARALAAGASAKEQAYIAALGKRYAPAEADRAARTAAYAAAMGELSRRFPDDLDAATLYAASLMDVGPWKPWSLRGTPGARTEEMVSILESVLKRDPAHRGADHYLIHALEGSPQPDRALPSAQRLAKGAAGHAHLLDLAAQAFLRAGDHAAATQTAQWAVAVDAAHGRDSLEAGLRLHTLAAAASMEGRFSEARAAAERAAALARPLALSSPGAESLVALPYFVAARFQKWDDVLAFPEPPAGLRATAALRHYARGIAFAAKGDLANAKAERSAFEAARARMPEGVSFGRNQAKAVLRLASRVLAARYSAAGGDRIGSLHWWMKAVEAQEELAFDPAGAWYYPVRESLGGEMLRAADLGHAETMFRADLTRHPRNPRSLFGLRETLRALGRTAEAERVDADLRGAWATPDTPLRIDDL